MLARLSHTKLLRYAGLFTWAMVGIPLLINTVYLAEDRGLKILLATGPGGWAAAYVAFGAGYWAVTRSLGERRPRWHDIALLLLITVAAIAVSHFSQTGLGGVLLLIVAGVLPWLLPLSIGILWLVLQHAALVPVFTAEGLGFSLLAAVLQSTLYVGYSSFAFVIGLVARQQAEAREEQRRLNAELRATRALLADSSRLSERMRISRELHDLLGHHLTALSLNLEVAGHLTLGKALEHVRQAHTLAKLLLTDVREAVSRLREDGAVDLSAALHTLVEGVPGLQIDLELPQPLLVEDPERANVLLRCAQEILTNALRHAGARHLRIRMERRDGAMLLYARDDGRGAAGAGGGHGLRGIRERLAAFGGDLRIETAPGKGFALDIRLPLEVAA